MKNYPFTKISLQSLIVISVLLFPFQNLSIYTTGSAIGSRYDLTAFLFLCIALYSALFHGISKRTLFYATTFLFIQVLVFAIFDIAPYYRLISGLVWLGGLLLLALNGHRIKYSQMTIFYSIVSILCMTSLYIFFQFFFLDQLRPAGWFREPSFAGLSLYSAAAGLFISFFLVKLPPGIYRLLIVIALVFFCAAILTLSLHFITFLITILLIMLILIFRRMFSFNLRRILIITILGILLCLVASNLFMSEHFASRLDIGNPTNLSLLSWLRGFDQMVAAVKISPIFGCGLGSTGFFEFNSAHSDTLEMVGLGILNLTDAFSLAFRLIIEVGLPFFILFIYFFLQKLNTFKGYIRDIKFVPTSISLPIVFNFVFSISVILGCLLKEPLYPQSYLYLSVFLLSSIPLGRFKGVRPRTLSIYRS